MDDVDDEGFGYVAVRKAEYIDPDEQILKESKIFFYPSAVTSMYQNSVSSLRVTKLVNRTN